MNNTEGGIMLIVHRVSSGPFEANCFVIYYESTHEAAIIDAGHTDPLLLQRIEENELQVKYIFITHAHIDHIAGLKELKQKTGAKVILHKGEEKMLAAASMQAEMFGLPPVNNMERLIDIWIEEEQEFDLGGHILKTINIPGHSRAGIGIYTDGRLFPGDALFAGSIGRTDLPGGNYQQILDSIRKKILTLSDETIVYPGHGPETTVGYERENNPFLQEL